MRELHVPWLTLVILIPALGAAWVAPARAPDAARRRSLVATGLALACAVAAWLNSGLLGGPGARDFRDPLAGVLHRELPAIDALSAPLLPLAALIYFLTTLSTLRTKVHRFSFTRSLASEAILLATLACELRWGVVALLAAGTVPPYLGLRRDGKPTRVYAVHMGLFVALLVAGQGLLSVGGRGSTTALAGIVLLTAAVLLRSGVAPLHCWMTDLFEHANLSTALLFVTPMVGVYGVTRLVLPVAPPWALQAIGLASLATAVYAAGMALVQREARRFFCYLFLSHSSLVLVGLETATPVGLTGALSLWPSVALALTGFGLTIRCAEFRAGRLSLAEFHGLYPHVPMLAGLFLITGLASIGFPGTAGFVGLELLVDGVAHANPLAGCAIVVVTALNGLAVMHAFFRIFGGRPHATSIDLRVRPAEHAAVLVLTTLILGGGLYPQPGVTSRYHAAAGLAHARALQAAPGGAPVAPAPGPPRHARPVPSRPRR